MEFGLNSRQMFRGVQNWIGCTCGGLFLRIFGLGSNWAIQDQYPDLSGRLSSDLGLLQVILRCWISFVLVPVSGLQVLGNVERTGG
jgi:hypothetical protein